MEEKDQVLVDPGAQNLRLATRKNSYVLFKIIVSIFLIIIEYTCQL
jgi:hypothetical protein